MFSLRHPSTRTRRRPTLVAILAVVMAAGSLPLLIAPAANAAPATPGPGYVDFNYGTGPAGPDEVTGYHSQSKLWFTGDSWWSVAFNVTAGDWLIYRLDIATQTWIQTTTLVDPRDKSHPDVLWDDAAKRLYVASSNDNAATNEIRVFTYSFDPNLRTYTLVDPNGAPRGVSTGALGVGFATIAKDSTGTLVIAYASSNKVQYMTSTGPDLGLVWSAPADVPGIAADHEPITGAPGATKQADDIAVVTPTGTGVGVMWSRTDTGFFFATRSSTGTWNEETSPYSGPGVGDNHISLKTAGDGQVIAAIKTGLTGARTLIAVLSRNPATGTWNAPSVVTQDSTSPSGGTRPMLVLDQDTANVFITNIVGGGKIFRRTAPLSTLNFGVVPSLGDVVIESSANPLINNTTSTKQVVNTAPAGAGLVVMAADATTKNYVHSCLGGTCTGAVTPPTAPVAAFTTSPETGTAPVSVQFRDTTSPAATSWEWNFGDGSAVSTEQSPVHVYAIAGAFTATLTATNAGGSNSIVKELTIAGTVSLPAPPPAGARAPAPPVASFTADSTSGRTPLTVQFADTSSPAATSWAWNFGDGATDTTKTPAHTYTRSGTYTVKLTATNADGAGTATATITVIPGGARFTPVNPTRVLAGKAVGAKKFTTLTLRPPNGASAVALNVTVTRATKSSSVAVCNGDLVGADCTSQTVLRVRKGTQAAGFTMTRLGAADRVKIYNAAGTATVNAYVEGWFVGKPTETYFVAQGNRRALTAKALGQNKSFTFKIPAGLRPAGTTAVALNVSASGASAATSVSVCPASTRKALCKTRPSLYAARGAAVANHVVTRMGPGGTVKLVNRSGSVRLTVNVQGVYTTAKTGATFRPNPVRRVVTGRGLTAKGTFTMAMRSLPPGTTSVALRVTLTSPTANGSVSVCRGGTTTTACKATSAVPVQRGRTATTVVVVRVGAGGTVKFYNAAGKNKLFVDVFGSYGRT